MKQAQQWAVVPVLAVLAVVAAGAAHAEPAFAMRTGYRCSTCHTNNTGGGIRTAFGSIYTQTILPAHEVRWRDGGNLLPANPDARFNAGADVRVQYLYVDTDEAENVSSFEFTEANVYLLGRLIPGKLDLYLDETVGPGGASTRELWAMYRFGESTPGWVKAGKFLPNYGIRLPDDNSFIRSQTGFTYSAPDTGVEFGIEPGRWTVTAAVINGEAGGGSDTNDEKKFVAQGVHRFRKWRIGASAATNIAADIRTSQGGLLAGASFGRLTFLGEIDLVETDRTMGTQERAAAYFEADLLLDRGVNLKYVHDWFDPDRDVSTDERTRDSLGIEYIPIPFLQVRAFVRVKDGPPQIPGSRDHQFDFELHLFF